MIDHYDAIIIGSGHAGYTAGIFLARFLFKTLLLDTMSLTPEKFERGSGRSLVPGLYMSVPGFPNGIERSELKWRGIQQAKNAGCLYQIDRAVAITKENDEFIVHCDVHTYRGKNIFIATGIEDNWGEIPGLETIVGRSLFLSVESNGKEAAEKPAAVIGHDRRSIESALHLRLFTDQIYLLTHGYRLDQGKGGTAIQLLEQLGIGIVDERIKTVVTNGSALEKIILDDNQEIEVNTLFSPSEFQRPRNELAKNLGVEVDDCGYIVVNDCCETNIPHVYAIGDITATPIKQVVNSYYHGMIAAFTMYDKHIARILPQAKVNR